MKNNLIDPLANVPLPAAALRGLQLFNAGDYFEAHEFLETAWRAETAPIRELYRGILQVGVGFYHLQRGNFPGAHKLFQRALRWLEPFPACCQGINVEDVRTRTQHIDALLVKSLPDPSQSTLESLFFPIQFDIHPLEANDDQPPPSDR